MASKSNGEAGASTVASRGKPVEPRGVKLAAGLKVSGEQPRDQSAGVITAKAAPHGQAEVAPSAPPVAEVRTSLGVSRELFARMTGFSVRAISGWEAGRPLSEAAMRRVTEMKRLRDALAQGVRPEFIAKWLVTPSEALGGLKPIEVLERGENDRLWRVVLLIGSGMPV